MGDSVGRGVAVAELNERQVQRGILAMARQLFPHVLLHHSPNGAHLAGGHAGPLLGDGMLPGYPDLACYWGGGGHLLMEVKRTKGGVVSDAQKAVHERLGTMGWPVSIVRSQDDAYHALRAAGAPCVGVLT